MGSHAELLPKQSGKPQYEWRDETVVTEQGPGSLLLPLQQAASSLSVQATACHLAPAGEPCGGRAGIGRSVGTGGMGQHFSSCLRLTELGIPVLTF